MSNYPNAQDDDVSIPRIDDNVSTIGGDVINDIRSAVFAIETTLGLIPQGTAPSVASRLATSLDPIGNILPSALSGLGLIYLPLTDSEVSPTAAIQESKLSLTYSTITLYNLYLSLNSSVETFNGFLSLIGIMVLPHINGTAYNHELSAILVDDTLPMLKTNPSALVSSVGTNVISRNTTNADTLIGDISNDLTVHEKADGNPNVTSATGGTVPPQNFAHNSTGLYVDPHNFTTIPTTVDTVQLFAEYVDQSSLLLLGSRVQTLYSNGIPRTARSVSLPNDGYGGPLVPSTPITAYLLGVPPGPISSTPVDDYNAGDDVISFIAPAATAPFTFDSQFALVQPGDIITINYNNGTPISYQFVIDSIKAKISGTNRNYSVRINGKNLFSTPEDGYGYARIDRSLFNREKYGVLAPAVAPTPTTGYESLIIANPRSAVALGNGFNASEFDSSHYNLYLMLYPNGDPTNTSTRVQMPAIDITGNLGATPGQYTLDSIVLAANTQFRAPGFNYRFIAFEYDGQFGIMLADPYNNASFSIVGGYGVSTTGVWTYGSGSSNATAQNCPNNVIDNGDPTHNTLDPLGFGITAANIASPPPAGITSFSYLSAISANLAPLLVFYPLSRNYFYTNGAERDRLRSDPNYFFQNIDVYGDGYWDGYIISRTVIIGSPSRVQVAYKIDLDLASTGLAIGKTLVVQPFISEASPTYNYRDYGRFVITNIQFYNCNSENAYTVITVYDGVHASGAGAGAGTSNNIPVLIYFSDDSVSFDAENVFDTSGSGPYRRYLEVFVDQNGHTFSHERARFLGTPSGVDGIGFVSISPKLRGYSGTVSEGNTIRLSVISFTAITGIYTIQLGKWASSTFTNTGPLTTGKQGETVRVYDETNIDYIDVEFSYTATSPGTGNIDIQLFPSLQLDEDIMCISTCMIDDGTRTIALLEDNREFGNVSEEQLSTSALAYIAASDRELRENGIIQGFDLSNNSLTTGGSASISFSGGVVTITGATGMVAGPPAQYITISNAAINGNNGTFEILSSNTYSNANGSSNDPNNGAIHWGIAGTSCNISLTGGSALVNGNIVNINNTVIEIPVIWEYLPNGATIVSITWFLCVSDSGELQLVASTDFDPNGTYASSYTTNNVDQDRLFNVINPSNLGAGHYAIRATYLANLVINYKDVTPLYVIEATVGPNIDDSGQIVVGYNILDARRYISKGFNGLDNALVLGPNSNFRSFQSLDTWLQQLTRYVSASNNLNTIGTNVIVKGSWIINTTIYMDYARPITFTGDDAAFIFQANTNGSAPRSGTISLGSNVLFNNITLDNQFDPTAVVAGYTDTNYNITYLSNNKEACIYVNIKSNLNAANPNLASLTTSNISVTGCEFLCANQYRFPFIVFNFPDRGAVATDIVIEDNSIISTSAVDDISSVIVFMTNATSTPSTPLTGPFLINAKIDNNICNKNQLIVVSAMSVSANIYDMITTINCSITNNTCGAICYSTKTGSLLNYTNGVTYLSVPESDKNDSLTIADNTCKYIYSGDGYGQIGYVVGGIFKFTSNLTSVPLGSASITNNTASWIHVAGPQQQNSYLYINNNILRAFDYAFLANYYGGSTSHILHSAIYVLCLRATIGGGSY